MDASHFVDETFLLCRTGWPEEPEFGRRVHNEQLLAFALSQFARKLGEPDVRASRPSSLVGRGTHRVVTTCVLRP